MQARLKKPLQLDQETRKPWIENPAHLSSLLINVFKFIFNAISDGEMKEKSTEYQHLRAIETNISQLFTNRCNTPKTAALGAYFRAKENPNLIQLSDEDLTIIDEVLRSMNKEDREVYLASFKGNTAREKHMAMLQNLIFTKHNVNMRPLPLKQKQKHRVDALIAATFDMIDFLNTPLALLIGEIEADDKKSSLVQRWSSIYNTFLPCLMDIASNKKNKKSKAALATLTTAIEKDLIAIQREVSVYKVVYDYEQKLQQLRDEMALHPNNPEWQVLYTRLAGYIHEIAKPQNEFDPRSDYAKVLHQYLEPMFNKMKELTAEKASSAILIAEKDGIIQAQQEQIAELKRAKPPVIPDAEMEAVQVHAPISEDEIYTKQQLIKDIGIEVDRIKGKGWQGNKKDRQEKIDLLNNLKKSIETTLNEKPLADILKDFFSKNFKQITHQRSTFFKTNQPESLTMLERYYNSATASIIMQAKPAAGLVVN